uniref:Integrase, catalytic region, zinc finger, CCHC-type, peptidase aspartic, catalytic n=1 Tax=Tanacetum cinerariifolium TaxID=118510 RepID=A0A6L2LAB9_TANCI|nr:integrase, catalytic region, zinc finger, CCHC-type, peptidase aspartic, catalytic [Tanacetum cinerariifolium]
MSSENKAYFLAEKEAIHLILTGIGDEIYSTVDACQIAQEMWEAIERLQQGESLNIQDVKTNLFWEFGKFTSHHGETMESYYTRFYKLMNEMIRNNLAVTTMQVNVQFLQQLQPEWSSFMTIVKQQHKLDEVSYHKLFDILKQYQNEVNELRAEILSRNANPLALDNNPEQDKRDNDMQKNLALIAKYFKKIYKPTSNNLRTSSNSSNKNVDTTLRFKNDNQSGQFGNQRMVNVAGAREKECRKPKRVKDFAYHNEKMLLCKQAEQGVPLQAEQYDWLADTDEEVDKQEFEAHYSYMAKIQEVPTADSGTDFEPLEQTKQTEFEKYKAFNDRIVDYDKLERNLNETLEIVDNAWIKHAKDQFRAPTAQDMEILIQTCLMPLATRTQNNSFRFVHEVKQEMHADLKYVESLKKEIDELESDKVEFSDMYDVILQECVSKDVMCSYLMSLSDLDALDELQCLYLHKVKECDCLAQKLTNQTKSFSKEVHNELLKRFCKVEKHSISLEIALQKRKEQVKNETVWNEKASNVFRKERKQYVKIQDLKAQLQDKNIVITHTRAPQLPQTVKNTNPRVSTSTGVNHKPNVSRPQYKSNQLRDKVLSNNSQVKVKKTQVEVHPRIPSVSNKMNSVTACKDSLNSRTLNANAVCATCNKCLVDSNHFACVTKMLNDVNARTNKPNIVQVILFIVDSGCTKHMMGNLKLLCNFVEKFLGTVHFGNDQFALILSYGDLVHGNVTINRVYYVEGLNHNLFSVGQFCDADLEVAFRKSTCFVRDLQGNDLLTGNRGSDLYTISLQESTSSTPLCLMAKATPTQAWLWHRRLSYLNFDHINLLLKKDIVIGLLKLKYVKDQLCSSCELSKAKRRSFMSKKRVASKNGKSKFSSHGLMWSNADADVPSQQELDLLFGPLYDEFLNAGYTSQDKQPSTNIQSTSAPSTPINVHAEENIDNQAEEGEQLQDDEFTNPFYHPLEQVCGNPSRPVQTRRQLAAYLEMCIYALTVSTAEPKNIKEAMADSAWIEAMQEELYQFDRLQVWELVDKPFGKMVTRLKWLWKNKKDEDHTVIRNKVRLVAKGYAQEEDGFVDPDHPEKVYRLKKALYGLKQAPKAWYDELLKFLTSKGFTKGLQIHQSPRCIFINQAKYTLEILHKHGMEKGQSIGTPMATKPKIDADLSGNPVDQTDYRSKIGSLMYLTSSRLDIVQAGSSSGLTAFSDADHAGCIDSHKSTSGGIQFLVSHSNLMQPRTALPYQAHPYAVSLHKGIVIRYDEDECDKGRMPTKIELTLEQSQQSVSNDVLVSIEEVEELKRNVWIKGEKKEAIHYLKAETGSKHMLSVFTKPEWLRFVTIVKQQHKLDEVSYHKLFIILRQYPKEVNEIYAERLANNANSLALVATAQVNQDPYCQTSKSHKSYAPSSKPSIPTRSHRTTRSKGKEIAKPITPLFESASKEDIDPEQAQRDKDMQKNLALIAKYIKKIYKPTNNNLKTSSNSRNKNVDTTSRYKNDNQSGQFRNQRTMNVAMARENAGSSTRMKRLMNRNWKHITAIWQRFKRFLQQTHALILSHWNSKTLRESNSVRDSCLVALQNKQTEFENYKAFNDRTVDCDKLERQLNETLGQLAQKDIEIKEGLKLKAYEISVVKEKHNELIKHSLLTKSHYEGLVKQKTRAIPDLKLKEEHDIDKMISLEKQLMFLNEIVYN